MASSTRRGGIQQRLQAEARELEAPSSLAQYLLVEFAWGRMSPQQVQTIAAHAVDDMQKVAEGKNLQELKKLSKIATGGHHEGNAYRDLMVIVNRTSNLPPASKIDLPTKRGESTSSLLLPHEVFPYLYHYDYEMFQKQFFPKGTSELERFWDQCKEHPNLRNQSVLENLEPAKTVPIGCHGDEVPVAGRGKTYCKYSVVWSWFSLCSTLMPTKQSLLLIWCANPAMFIDGAGGTLDCFWLLFAWSLSILATGRWPHADWRGIAYERGSAGFTKAGRALAGGFKAVLCSLVGDLDYFHKFMNLAHWSSNQRPCTLCRCTTNGPLTWKDYRTNAPWRATVYTPETWRADPDVGSCRIFDAPHVSGCTLQPDWMHIKFLGFMQYFLGSCLFVLTHHIMPSSPLHNLHRIGLMVCRLQRASTTTKMGLRHFAKLTLFMKKKGFPKMKGSAASIKCVIPAIRKIWDRFRSQDNVVHQRVSLIFQLDAQVERILQQYSPLAGYYALPADQAAIVFQKQNQLSALMVMLEEHYADEPRPLFNTVSKLHYTAHSTSSAGTMHPFLSWCWRGEDFMSVTSTLVSSCLRGRNDVAATVAAIDKYRFALHQQWR